MFGNVKLTVDAPRFWGCKVSVDGCHLKDERDNFVAHEVETPANCFAHHWMSLVFQSLPTVWSFIKEAGLIGWAFYMVIEWLVSRESSRQKAERLAQIGRAEAERKQELEEIDRRRRDTYDAIKKWVELPITRFHDKQDTLPLAEKALERSVEIEECLSRNYPSIWRNLKKLRQEYHEWKSTDSAARFTRIDEGRTVINIDNMGSVDLSAPVILPLRFLSLMSQA